MSAGLRTIAIVDDDEAVRDSLSVLLDAHGFNIQVFVSGDAFLEAQASQSDCFRYCLHAPLRRRPR